MVGIVEGVELWSSISVTSDGYNPHLGHHAPFLISLYIQRIFSILFFELKDNLASTKFHFKVYLFLRTNLNLFFPIQSFKFYYSIFKKSLL